MPTDERRATDQRPDKRGRAMDSITEKASAPPTKVPRGSNKSTPLPPSSPIAPQPRTTSPQSGTDSDTEKAIEKLLKKTLALQAGPRACQPRTCQNSAKSPSADPENPKSQRSLQTPITSQPLKASNQASDTSTKKGREELGQLEEFRKRIHSPSFEEISNDDQYRPPSHSGNFTPQTSGSGSPHTDNTAASRLDSQQSDRATKCTSEDTTTSGSEAEPGKVLTAGSKSRADSRSDSCDKGGAVPDIEFDYDAPNADGSTSDASSTAHPVLFDRQIRCEAQHLELLGLGFSRPAGRRRSLFPKAPTSIPTTNEESDSNGKNESFNLLTTKVPATSK